MSPIILRNFRYTKGCKSQTFFMDFGQFSGALSFLIVFLFVGSLYLVPSEVRKLPRNDLRHVKYRVFLISMCTIFLLGAVYLFLRVYAPEIIFPSYFDFIGLRFDTLFDSCAVTICLMCIFYLGVFLLLCWCYLIS